MKATIELHIRAEITHNETGWIAASDAFGAVGLGSTGQEAITSLKEALKHTIDWCIEHGTLFEALEKEEIKQKMVLPKPTEAISYEQIDYRIPLGKYGKKAERVHI